MNAAIKLSNHKSDWHPADVVASLKKKGTSLSALERANGYARTSFSMLWSQRWPKAQEIVAAAIGVKPWVIWPSRYGKDNTPITGRLTRIPTRVAGRNA
jgi:Ner family transcriptional regulator